MPREVDNSLIAEMSLSHWSNSSVSRVKTWSVHLGDVTAVLIGVQGARGNLGNLTTDYLLCYSVTWLQSTFNTKKVLQFL